MILSQFSDKTLAQWLYAAPVLTLVSFIFLCLTWPISQPSIWLLGAFLLPFIEVSAKFLFGFSSERYRALALLVVVLLLHAVLLTLAQGSAATASIARLVANLQYMAAVLLGMGIGLLVFRKVISSKSGNN